MRSHPQKQTDKQTNKQTKKPRLIIYSNSDPSTSSPYPNSLPGGTVRVRCNLCVHATVPKENLEMVNYWSLQKQLAQPTPFSLLLRQELNK